MNNHHLGTFSRVFEQKSAPNLTLFPQKIFFGTPLLNQKITKIRQLFEYLSAAFSRENQRDPPLIPIKQKSLRVSFSKSNIHENRPIQMHNFLFSTGYAIKIIPVISDQICLKYTNLCDLICSNFFQIKGSTI